MAERKDNRGRKLRTGEYYNPKTHIYQFRKMVDGERVTITDTDLEQLRKRENEILVAIDQGKNLKNRNRDITLDQYFDFWVSTYAVGKRKATTITNYRSYYNTYIKGKLGKKKLAKVTKVDCQLVFNQLIEDDKSHSTMANLKSCLSKIFECAIDDEIMTRNPVMNIDLPKGKIKERTAVSDLDIQRFMEYVKGSSDYSIHYSLFVLMFNTGVRVGELAALTWNDIDFDNNTIKINKTVNRYRKKDHGFTVGISTPKNRTSIRTVVINDIVRKSLLKHRLQSVEDADYQVPYVSESGKITGQCSGFVFLNSHGHIYTEPVVRNIIKSIVESHNKECDPQNKISYFCPHMVRHTFTTLAYESGANPKVVSKILGHKNTNVTMEVYTHIRDEEKKQKQVVSAVNVG